MSVYVCEEEWGIKKDNETKIAYKRVQHPLCVFRFLYKLEFKKCRVSFFLIVSVFVKNKKYNIMAIVT